MLKNVAQNATLKKTDILPLSYSESARGAVFFSQDGDDYCLIPGLADVHVHLREPGFSYKETIGTGTRAAAHGGYTAVCAMPNLDPVPDSADHLQPQLAAIQRDAVINVYPYGSITAGEKGETLSDMEAVSPLVCAFSDDGKGVQSDAMMAEAMIKAKSLGKLIAAHCEDESLLRGGYIHDGSYAKAHGHRGICSKSEWGQVARDLELVAKTGCAYHVCHVSTKESVALIRNAKKAGLNVSCETSPHYLLLDDSNLKEEGRFKMNPPLRDRTDREALIEGVLDGTIEIIATDHAPHSAEEKSRGLEKSPFGITGLECAFPLLYTYLVERNVLTLDALLELMCHNPRRRFGLPLGKNDFSMFRIGAEKTVDSSAFVSMGKSTPFDGYAVHAECVLTVCESKISWLAI